MATGKASAGGGGGGGPSSAGNFVGTVALAVAALGMTAAMYVANWRRARRGGDGLSSTGKADGPLGGGVSAVVGVEGPTDGGQGVVGASAGRSGVAVAAAGASGGCALPQRNYYSIRAERHTQRHNANLVEWVDEALGVVIPFSPILFSVTREERQAPMVLLTLRNLRQPSHDIAVAIEELCETQGAASYQEASLSKIVDCARILSTTPIRIGNTNHPSAEYCYVGEHDQMHFVMAIFVCHERLALTIQYSAATRVRNLLPTAFYELVRSIRFPQARPTPSYLLVSEPRLGLGFRLALDFMVHEGLAESMERSVALSATGAALGGGDGGGGGSGANLSYSYVNNRATGGARGTSLGPADTPADGLAAASGSYHHGSTGSNATGSLAGLPGGAVFTSPFATAVGRGTRRMGLIASYEPSAAAALGAASGGAAALAATPRSTASHASGGPSIGAGTSSPQWHQFLDRQLQLVIRRLGVRLGGPTRVVFREATSGSGGSGGNGGGRQPPLEEPALPGQIMVRPYRLSLTRRGNFGGAEEDDDYGDGDDDDTVRASVSTIGSCCVQEVRLDANSPYLQLIRDSLDQLSSDGATAQPDTRASDGSGGVAAQTLPAYLGIFYVPIRDECVSFTFVASAQRHRFEEFVSWCSATMQSASLGNHFGQSTSVLYCNLRHEILPFTLALQPGTQAVEEPQLGDPLAVVSTYGVERTTALLRVFPLLQVLPTSSSGTGTPANTSGGQAPRAGVSAGGNVVKRGQGEKQRQRTQARVLEHMLRGYLGQLSEAVNVLSWERCAIHGMAAMRFCFEQLGPSLLYAAPAGAGGGGAPSATENWDELDGCSVAATDWLSSRSLVLEEEVGSMNPFSRYYPPPPPSLAYLGLRSPPPPPPPPPLAKDAKRGTVPQPAQSSAGLATAEKGKAPSPSAPHQDQAPALPQQGLIVGGGDGMPHANASMDSIAADDSADDPLRVGVVVCAEGHAFMFTTATSVYSCAVGQQMVEELAAHFAINTAAAP